MADFTLVEKKLVNQITNSRLRHSLESIRQAMEDIWKPETPRIIRDYTDHGVRHCERIAENITELLRANKGQALSDQEIYLLLAGVYLHDIGMQCDVVTFPAIRKRAERLGAQFDLDFRAKWASDYSLDEQQAVRKNHHYLSAAWIEHACLEEKSETILSQPAQTIPTELIEDLMDICKYHTKLSLNECDAKLRFDRNGRKRLVAALLRFADELDIASSRVSIQTVKNFSLDSRNSLYWWLHHRTTINFSSLFTIKLIVRLHPDDENHQGDFIYGMFVDEFGRKNDVVLDILAQHDIPIRIDSTSGVESYKFEPLLPSEIVQILEKMNRPNPNIPPPPAPSKRGERIKNPPVGGPSDAHIDTAATNDLKDIDPETLTYDFEKIRSLLDQGFTDQALRYFCYDIPEFVLVYNQLGPKTRKANVIDQLIKHADQKSQIENLFTLAQEKNRLYYEDDNKAPTKEDSAKFSTLGEGKVVESPPSVDLDEIFKGLRSSQVDDDKIIYTSPNELVSIRVVGTSAEFRPAQIEVSEAGKITLRSWFPRAGERQATESMQLENWPYAHHFWQLRRLSIDDIPISFDHTNILAVWIIGHKATGQTLEKFLVLVKKALND